MTRHERHRNERHRNERHRNERHQRAAPTSGTATAGAPGYGAAGQGPGGGGQGRSDETVVTGSKADTLRAAALKAVPGGTVDRIETDAGDAAYEVHMTKSDGTRVTVKFSDSLALVRVEDGMGLGDPAPPRAPARPARRGRPARRARHRPRRRRAPDAVPAPPLGGAGTGCQAVVSGGAGGSRPCHVVRQASLPSASASTQKAGAAASLSSRPPAASAADQASLAVVVGDAHVEVDAVALRPWSVHLLEPHRGTLPCRVEQPALGARAGLVLIGKDRPPEGAYGRDVQGIDGDLDELDAGVGSRPPALRRQRLGQRCAPGRRRAR